MAAALGVASTPDPDLREVGQGAWEGRLVADILAEDGDRLRTWRRTPVGHEAPGGETLAAVAGRARRALSRVLATLEAASATRGPGDPDRAPVIGYGAGRPDEPWGLIVSHDGLLRVIMLQLLGLSLERFWAFPFVPAGISVIEFHGGHVIVRAHDLEEHLAPLEAAGPPVREGAL
jgi:alpha-ribazole phosphatase